ncbi:hypothetical protein MPP7335_02797 [Mycolicibacterium parafortuitum]|uniref:Uncharacterized protein n=1 Tax=Mycolicibacterium parafortuitum TaxID=39692 RepID=A0A375YIW4_MYCPF|nr:hypothetical protein MPP7335_02797 [Mycolicibacterium parafortuitum]
MRVCYLHADRVSRRVPIGIGDFELVIVNSRTTIHSQERLSNDDNDGLSTAKMLLQVKLLLADHQRTSGIVSPIKVFARHEVTIGNGYGGKGPQTKPQERLPAGNPELPDRPRPPGERVAVYLKLDTEFAEIAAACRVRASSAVPARPLRGGWRGASTRVPRRYSSGRRTGRRYRVIRIRAVNCLGVAQAIAGAARPRGGPAIRVGGAPEVRAGAVRVVWRGWWCGTVWWRRTLVYCSVGNDGVDPAGRPAPSSDHPRRILA